MQTRRRNARPTAPALAASAERYGLNWPGKAQSIRTMRRPSSGTLRAVPEQSVDFERTAHAIVEGDNLEVLKLLQPAYAGTVKLIYIDPPYNTGNDFVYPDDYGESLRTYLQSTGQADARGRHFGTNAESNGRFHSAWLTMMFPRLLLARNLLREDGVIMVSIGDDEVHNLRSMLGEIFGERNYCGTFVWEKKRKPSFLDSVMGSKTEYIVTFAKDRRRVQPFTHGTVERGKRYPFNNAGNPPATLTFAANSVRFAIPDGRVEPQDMSKGNITTRLLDPVDIRDGKNRGPFRLLGEWRYSQATLDAFIAARDEIVIRRLPFRPNYVSTSERAKKTANLLTIKGSGTPTYEDAAQEMRRLFGEDVVDYPKPVGLLRFLIGTVTRDTDLVLDFFAGSGTTAHAVLELNALDGGKRRFMLVQLPEPTGRADFPTLADVARERVRRAIRAAPPPPHGAHPDRGFRAFRLIESSLQPGPRAGDELAAVFELLLESGFPLSTPVTCETIAGKRVYAAGDGSLLVCFERALTSALLHALAARQPARVTLLEEAFAGNDQLKTNAALLFGAKNIAFRTR